LQGYKKRNNRVGASDRVGDPSDTSNLVRDLFQPSYYLVDDRAKKENIKILRQQGVIPDELKNMIDWLCHMDEKFQSSKSSMIGSTNLDAFKLKCDHLSFSFKTPYYDNLQAAITGEKKRVSQYFISFSRIELTKEGILDKPNYQARMKQARSQIAAYTREYYEYFYEWHTKFPSYSPSQLERFNSFEESEMSFSRDEVEETTITSRSELQKIKKEIHHENPTWLGSTKKMKEDLESVLEGQKRKGFLKLNERSKIPSSLKINLDDYQYANFVDPSSEECLKPVLYSRVTQCLPEIKNLNLCDCNKGTMILESEGVSLLHCYNCRTYLKFGKGRMEFLLDDEKGYTFFSSTM
jgi:hypothetical protein